MPWPLITSGDELPFSPQGTSRAAAPIRVRWRCWGRQYSVPTCDPGTLIVADGFSCKTQIEDAGTGRRALHVAQVMALGRDRASGQADAARDQRAVLTRPQPALSRRIGRVAAVTLPAAALSSAVVLGSRAARCFPRRLT